MPDSIISTDQTPTDPEWTIRRAEAGDVDTLIALITALAEFEHLPPPDADARERLAAHGFGDKPKFEAWLAELQPHPNPSLKGREFDEPVAAGYAFIFEAYSTFLARPTLYLEDLFVLPDYRGRGIGKRLLNHCVRLANERGCGRMEWTCLDWNTRAQAVYESMGARHMSEWFLYRMTRDEIASAAG
jgi:GNAT superfamily N-acetyltransferase